MENRKDFIGQELYLGDSVAYTQGNYKTLYTGTITKFNPKLIQIRGRFDNLTNVSSNQLVKIVPQEKA